MVRCYKGVAVFEILRDFFVLPCIRVRAIPTFRVYRLYDTFSERPLIIKLEDATR